MATHGRGLICLCLTEERCDELGLRQMTERNETPFGTAFTVSIEAREGITTGISARRPLAHDPGRDRPVARAPTTSSSPGHVFPLRARRGGVLERAGQTEAAVDLARLAGLQPGRRRLRDHERRRDDGPRPRPRPVLRAARAEDGHGRRPDRVPPPPREARRAHDRPCGCRRATATSRPIAFRETLTGKNTSRSSRATSRAPQNVLVRVHSECLTGDVFHSLRCDCGEQLDLALPPDRRGRARRAALHGAGGPRDRPAQQAQGLRAAGAGARHRRGEPRARLPGRRARLRDRQPDPRRPRPHDDPDPHEQPEEDRPASRASA